MSIEFIAALLTLVGFLTLAVLVLLPVHFFLNRQEEISDEWTEEKLAKRMREQQSAENGADGPSPPQP